MRRPDKCVPTGHLALLTALLELEPILAVPPPTGT
jgi:hypothetical protein